MIHFKVLQKVARLILIAIFLSPGCFAQKRNDIESKEGIRILLGASANSYHVNGPNKNHPPTSTDFKTTFSPVLGIGYYSHMGFEYGSYFFYPLLEFSYFKNSGDQVVVLNDGTPYQNVTTTEKAGIISFALNFGYNIIHAKKIIIEMYAGPAVNVLPGSKQVQEKYTLSTGTTTTSEIKGKSVTFSVANVGITAVLKNKMLIWVSSASPSVTTNFNLVIGRFSTLQAGIGYTL